MPTDAGSHPAAPPSTPEEIPMRKITALLACLALAGPALAADEMKKDDGMMKKDAMTMEQCKEHMAMAKKDGMKKDDATMKKDAVCADMMKKDEMMKKDAMTKKEEPMKK
jgi:pentapeptide MXKDX repeat protein